MKSFYATVRLADVKPLADKLSLLIQGGEVLALVGSLGSGKTTFTQHLCCALAVRQKVTSPTFTLMQIYSGLTKSSQPLQIYHLDLYRLASMQEVAASGLSEPLGQPGTLSIVEWADKAPACLPPTALWIKFVRAYDTK